MQVIEDKEIDEIFGPFPTRIWEAYGQTFLVHPSCWGPGILYTTNHKPVSITHDSRVRPDEFLPKNAQTALLLAGREDELCTKE